MRTFTLTVFALFLLAPAGARLLGLRAEAFENRAFAEFPSWTLASFVDQESYAKLGVWIKDHLPLRAGAVALNSFIDYRLFGESPSPEVLVGEGGELFLADTVRWPTEPAAAPEAVVANLQRFAGVLRASKIDFYVIVSPNKASLYGHRLPSMAAADNELGRRARVSLRALLSAQTNFVALDLWTAFEKQLQAGHRLFPKLDRHADSMAALLLAREMVEAVEPGIWLSEEVRALGSREVAGELPEKFMNLEIPQSLEFYRLERPGVEFKRSKSFLAPASKWPIVSVSARSETRRLLPGRTLVVHDSFMIRSRDPFSRFTEQVQFLRWEEFVKHPDAAAQLFRGVDRVFFQLAEDRRGFDLGPKSLRRVEAIQAALREAR